MTTEQAIKLLHRLQDEQFDGIHGDERREALEMAVRALESNLVKESGDLVKDLVKDCISRQAAIVVFENSGLDDDSKDTVVRVLEQLPSAQPEYEPVTAEDFAKTMSENTLYGYMAWHGEAITLMNEMGFVICKKTM